MQALGKMVVIEPIEEKVTFGNFVFIPRPRVKKGILISVGSSVPEDYQLPNPGSEVAYLSGNHRIYEGKIFMSYLTVVGKYEQ